MKRSIRDKLCRALAAILCLGLPACHKSEPEGLMDMMLAGEQALVESVDEAVTDPQRNAKLHWVIERLNGVTKEFFHEMNTAQERAILLSMDYDATMHDFREIQTLAMAKRRQSIEKLVGLAMEARRYATEEEWAAIATGLEKRRTWN